MPVIAIGELVVDWLSTEPGEDLLHARQFHRALGGNSANVAIGLNRLGTPVRFIAKIGSDLHGEYLKEHLRREGMDLGYLIVDDRHPTAQCYMTTRLDGEHEYRNWPKPNAAIMLVPDELNEKAFDGAKYLHATGISFIEKPRRDAIQHALNVARQRNIPISFDGLFPTGMTKEAHEFVETALFQSQLLKLNEHELMFWAGDPGPSSIMDAANRVFDKYQPVALMVTQAERGSFVLSARGVADCPPVPVECVCGVGAGDAYIAGALHALYSHYGDRELSALSNEDWKRVGTCGNVAGALATRSIDAYSGIPTADELANWLGKVPT